MIAVCAVALLHMAAVTLAAIPANRYSQHAQPVTSYLSPYFTQNWRLFAPNPIASDRTIEVQGAWRDQNGEIQKTEWLDWSDVELNTIRHRLVGSRGGYVTNKLFGSLTRVRQELIDTQRDIADETSAKNPPSWHGLREELLGAGNTLANAKAVGIYIGYDQAVTRLASDVVSARWPSRSFTAVRYRLRSRTVLPYESRNLPADKRDEARPEPNVTDSGWRIPAKTGGNERDVVADYYGRHK